MNTLADVEWEACLLQPVENPEALRSVRKQMRPVPTAVHYFLDSPWIIRSLIALDHARLPVAWLSTTLCDLVPLVVSQDNSCRYCYAVTRSVLKILGVSDEQIARVEQDLPVAEFSPETRVCLDFVRQVSRANPLATRREAEPLLGAGLTVDFVKELAFLTAMNVYYNRLSTLPALPIGRFEQMSEHWAVRLFRPLIAAVMRRQAGRRAAPLSLTRQERSGPLAPLINSLDGLPAAPVLRRVVDDAWASPVLPRRTKAIVFAVVARGLGCCVSEAEAVRILREEGANEAQAEEILSHFDTTGLTPQERAIAPYARETIWYRPAQIQRRTRDLQEVLNRDQLVEVIGLAALANMVCRLSVAVDLSRAEPA